MHSIVKWRAWSREAFEEAARRDLPVFLVLEQFWCGLSRMLYVTAWNNPEVAHTLEEGFVPVKVDAARRPDVDRRFRMGGWPSLVFLTPDGRPITGSTFMPPEVLMNALENVSSMYHGNRQDVLARVQETEEAQEAARNSRFDSARTPSPWMTARIVEIIKSSADRNYGGFGEAPKFPHFDVLQFLMALYPRVQDQDLLDLATDTLDAMAQNGLMDWEEGGFFRISDEADWSSPRYEKLLVDQAGHINAAVSAYILSGDLEHRETAEAVVDYVRRHLLQPLHGVFSHAQASDPDYYQSGAEERSRRNPPETDTTVFLDANCRMVRALYNAAAVLEEGSLAQMADRALQGCLDLLGQGDELAWHYHDSSPHGKGLLLDQVELALALLDAWQYTGKKEHLQHCLHYARLIRTRFSDSLRPGYFDAENPCGLNRVELRDKAYEDNVLVSVLFSRLAHLEPAGDWLDSARSALMAFSGVWEKLGPSAAAYGIGLLEMFAEPIIVELTAGGTELAEAARSLWYPGVLFAWQEGDEPMARVRHGQNVLIETSDPAQLRQALQEAVDSLPQKPTPTDQSPDK